MNYRKIASIASRCVTGYYELFCDIYDDKENIKNNKPTIEYAYVSLFRKVWERFEFEEDCIYEAMAISVLYGTIIADEDEFFEACGNRYI